MRPAKCHQPYHWSSLVLHGEVHDSISYYRLAIWSDALKIELALINCSSSLSGVFFSSRWRPHSDFWLSVDILHFFSFFPYQRFSGAHGGIVCCYHSRPESMNSGPPLLWQRWFPSGQLPLLSCYEAGFPAHSPNFVIINWGEAHKMESVLVFITYRSFSQFQLSTKCETWTMLPSI